MGALDHLKVQTEKQRIRVVLPDRWPGEEISPGNAASALSNTARPSTAAGNARGEAAECDPEPDADSSAEGPCARAGPAIRSISPTYYSYWIKQMEEAHAAAPPIESFLDAALQNAPVGGRPPADDERIFRIAGGTLLSFQEVAHWLKLRAALQTARTDPVAGRVSPDVARYWLRQLDRPGSVGAPHTGWADRCQRVADAADSIGKGLPPAVVAGLQAHPAWARAYLKCGSVKARLAPVEARRKAGRPSAVAAEALIAGDRRADSTKEPCAVPPDPIVHQPAGRPVSSSIPSGDRPVADVGWNLGAWAGRWVGGAMAGLKAGLTRAVSGTPPATGAADRFQDLKKEPPTVVQEQDCDQAVAEAEQALTAFTRASQHLQEHPALSAFWRAVDQQADRRFQGDRCALFREMAHPSAHPAHPLREELENALKADAQLTRHYQAAYVAFDRLRAAWRQCASVHQRVGQRWAPSTEQMQRVRTACGHTPPRLGDPILMEQAERLMQMLIERVRQTFRRPRPADRDATVAPAS